MQPLARPLAFAVLSLLALARDPPRNGQDPPHPLVASQAADALVSEAVREARSLLAQAKASRGLKDRADARAKAAQAADRVLATAPEAWSPAEDQLLDELGVFVEGLGDLNTARIARERLLHERQSRLPSDHPEVTSVQWSLGITLSILGDLSAAQALFEQVLEARERTLPADHYDLVAARMNLATALAEQGDLPRARVLLERALEVGERTLPADHRYRLSAQLNLASILFTQGDLPAARALEERVLATRERTLPEDHPDLATTRGNLAVTLFQQGDLAGARALCERVVDDLGRMLPDDHPEVMTALLNLANVLLVQDDLVAARLLQERVLERRERALPDDHPDVASARASLAITLQHLDELPSARSLQENVLQTRERAQPIDARSLAAAQLDLASTLAAQGELPAARLLLERVLEFQERTLPADHPDLARPRAILAQILVRLIARMGPKDPAVEPLRTELAKRALDFVRGLRRMGQAALLDGSPREVEERLASQDGWLQHAFSMARGYGLVDLGPELTAEVFLLCESSRAGGLIASRLTARAGTDSIGRERRAALASASDALARQAQSGASAGELARAHVALDSAGRELAQHAHDLLGSKAPIEPTLELLAQKLGPDDALVGWRRTTLAIVRRGDPLAWSDVESLVAFVLRAPAPRDAGAAAPHRPRLELVDLGPIAPIESAIERWRRLLGAPVERGVEQADRAADLDDAGRNVRALVLDPLRDALKGVDRLVVALDDALHSIPLDALPTEDPAGRFGRAQPVLGDVMRIEVRASLIETLLEPPRLAGRSTLLAIGHAAFDADPAGAEPLEVGTLDAAVNRSAPEAGVLRGGMWERGFVTLPDTRVEIRGTAQYFEEAFGENGSAVVLERRRASRDALFELAPTARWLHVATHAWFAPDSVRSDADPQPAAAGGSTGFRMDAVQRVRGMSPMLLCGLALSGANLPVNAVGRIPGLVTAQEIAALDLSNCELAVLSACDTNVGLRRAGQGVASLQKALGMAGAGSMITSLWKVPDEATKDLMVDFYRRVWIEKKPKHQALWEAKSKLRNEKDERGRPSHPTRDWAGWVLTGHPE